MGAKMKHMSIAEFRDFGFLQELNRQFLHPLGVALEVRIDSKTGEVELGGVWDCRDDPTGMIFSPGLIDQGKAERVKQLREQKRAQRQLLLGYVIQPCEDGDRS